MGSSSAVAMRAVAISSDRALTGMPSWPHRLRRSAWTELFVVAAYAVLAAQPFILGATRDEFWDTAAAPTAAILFAVLVFALVRGHRWAWILLLAFQLAVLISFLVAFEGALALAANILSLVLLLSAPMRRHAGLLESADTPGASNQA
jgi:hypothetical protein